MRKVALVVALLLPKQALGDSLDAAPSRFATHDGAKAARRGQRDVRHVRPLDLDGRSDQRPAPRPRGEGTDVDDRLRRLREDAQPLPTGPRPAADVGPRVLDPDGYVARTEPVFEKTAFFEKEIARRTERFGHIAQVFSTYEARHDPAEPKPFLRGINSFQLVFDGARWWVVTIFWEVESPGVAIPKGYLP